MAKTTELEEFIELLEGWQPKCISLQSKEVLFRLNQAEQRGKEQILDLLREYNEKNVNYRYVLANIFKFIRSKEKAKDGQN